MSQPWDDQQIPYHPRQVPRVDGPLTIERVQEVFEGCVDFDQREVLLGNDPRKRATVFSIMGMVRIERANEYVLRPIVHSEQLRHAETMEEAFAWMQSSDIYNLMVTVCKDMDQVTADLINGKVVFAAPEWPYMLSYFTATEEKRSISQPENEPAVKGGRDSFVETVRTNTSLVRRRIRTPALKIKEQIVGRQTLTPVDIVYIDGLTNPDLVKETEQRIQEIDIDALLASANLEEYLIDEVDTPFPLMTYTERPDLFCSGLVEGRVGVLADGLPLGFLLPGTLGQFLKAGEDRSQNWLMASCIKVLRYLCMLVTLFLPAFYVAAVNFHPEMLPARLAWSIAEAKLDVPFSTVFEVLILLIAFEIVQEAGLRLPTAIGQTVSILGGLVVGTAAVEAKIVSPAVLIAVAVAGIAGFTMPSQELAGALRIWRFILVIAASLAGLFGLVVGAAVLIYRLAALESFGVPYLTPFAAVAGEEGERGWVIRWPLPWMKFRERSLKTQNRRNQR